MNPYSLWWPYDRIGFGAGHGVAEGGHNLELAWVNTRHSLQSGYGDLFGWWKISWLFLPFGLWAGRRNQHLLLLASVFLSLVLVYLAYWVGSWLFGPRYYYEGFFSLTLVSAVGIAWLAGWPLEPGPAVPSIRKQRIRSALVLGCVGLLVAYNLAFYLQGRLGEMRGLYDVRREYLEPFQLPQSQEFTPALIIVHTGDDWIEYGRLLELADPFLQTPFIFAISRGVAADQAVIDSFPERKVFHYYPDRPRTFYTAPRPEPISP